MRYRYPHEDAVNASLDAPTTLPRQANTLGLAERLGGILVQPVRSLRAIAGDDTAHPAEPLLVYASVVLALHAAESYRLLALVGDAPVIALRRLFDVVLRAGRTDLVVVVVAAIVVGGIGRLRGQRFLGTAIATTYLLVPLTLMKAIGGILAVAGLDLWALPHNAVDSMVVVKNGRVDMVRFGVKCAVAYGPGLGALVAWLVTLPRALDPPRAVGARAGAALLVATVGILMVVAGVDVTRRSEALRPRHAGDAFPSMSLPLLDGKGRLDAVSRLDAANANVLIVDFWASWCGPCKRSLPELSSLAAAYQDKGLVVVGVNREPSDLKAARATWHTLAPSFDSVVDTGGLGERLGLTSLPSTYVVDHRGEIRHLHLGYTAIDVIRAEVDAVLAEAR